MILILSQCTLESSSEEVIDWISHLGGNYRRINGNDLKESDYYFLINNNDSKFSIANNLLNIDNVNVIWYRRWNDDVDRLLPTKKNLSLINTINTHRKGEHRHLSTFFFSILKNKKWINTPDDERITKNEMLLKAKLVGLEIPNTILTTSKKDAMSFKNKFNKIIIKSISNTTLYMVQKKFFGNYTCLVSDDDVVNFPSNFYPTLFQEYLEKEYELRIFYCFGKLYSMAIFSQNDKQTEIDFRQYNYDKPNRNVPYKLPKLISQKIVKLMNYFGCKTGSIDMVKTKDGRYVFLEINPVGQFGMTSKPCHYYIEKVLAIQLIKTDKNERKN
jgi:ATP-GRASP peptide maturase of grasp-with-spasm system